MCKNSPFSTVQPHQLFHSSIELNS